jgi:hypothetical protein
MILLCCEIPDQHYTPRRYIVHRRKALFLWRITILQTNGGSGFWRISLVLHLNQIMKNRFTLRFLFTIVTLVAMLFQFGQGTTAHKPCCTVSETIGISKVTIDYSRPSIKGRDLG